MTLTDEIQKAGCKGPSSQWGVSAQSFPAPPPTTRPRGQGRAGQGTWGSPEPWRTAQPAPAPLGRPPVSRGQPQAPSPPSLGFLRREPASVRAWLPATLPLPAPVRTPRRVDEHQPQPRGPRSARQRLGRLGVRPGHLGRLEARTARGLQPLGEPGELREQPGHVGREAQRSHVGGRRRRGRGLGSGSKAAGEGRSALGSRSPSPVPIKRGDL